MTHFLSLILVLLGIAWYYMTADERARVLRSVMAAVHKVRETVTLQELQTDPFFDALRARTRRVVATPLLIVLSATVFILLHSPVLDVVVSAICLLQIGLILERLVGRVAFTTVYIASGAAAAITAFSASSDGMSVSASAPVLGMYGLLLVTAIAITIKDSSVTIPLNVMKRLAAVAGVFFVYKLATTGLGNVAALAPLVCGLVGGIVIARDVNERTPRVRGLVKAMAAIVAVVGLYAATTLYRPPVNDTVDVRMEINQLINVEDRTAALYEREVDRFRKGRITTAALADVIEGLIVPELHAAAVRLRALQNVPPQYRGLIAKAETFLKLRDESWRLRASALHMSDMRALRQADRKEQASREAFNRLKMPVPQDTPRQPSS